MGARPPRDKTLLEHFRGVLKDADWAARMQGDGLVAYTTGKVLLYVPDESVPWADEVLGKALSKCSQRSIPIEKVLPENMFRQERFAPGQEAWEGIGRGGVFLLVPREDGSSLLVGAYSGGEEMEVLVEERTGLVGGYPCCFALPRALFERIGGAGRMTEYGATLAYTSIGSEIPVVTLVGESLSLCTTVCADGRRPQRVRMPDRAWYNCVLTDAGLVLEKRRKDTMKGLGSPLKKTQSQDVMEVAAQAVENVEAAAAAQEPASEPVQEPVKEPVKETPKETVKEQVKEAPKPVPQPKPAPQPQKKAEEPVKEPIPPDAVLEESVADIAEAQAAGERQRQRKAPLVATKKHLASWQAVSDEISSPTGDIDNGNLDFLLEEERVLRDLIVSASRRLFNLNAAAVKSTKDAVDKYAAIRSLLK